MSRIEFKIIYVSFSNIAQVESEKVVMTAEVANLLADVLDCFPHELDIKRWDFIRITLSSWVLTISKGCDYFKNENVSRNSISN